LHFSSETIPPPGQSSSELHLFPSIVVVVEVVEVVVDELVDSVDDGVVTIETVVEGIDFTVEDVGAAVEVVVEPGARLETASTAKSR
jgi:hypothetical protein